MQTSATVSQRVMDGPVATAIKSVTTRLPRRRRFGAHATEGRQRGPDAQSFWVIASGNEECDRRLRSDTEACQPVRR